VDGNLAECRSKMMTPRKAPFLTLITANGVTRHQHYIDTIDSHVQAERFIGDPIAEV
jgi:hypothetical protein